VNTAAEWRLTFSSFEARKTNEAMRAVTPPYVTVTDVHDPRLIPIATPWSASRFDGAFYISDARHPDLPTCSLVFVQSADGNTVASDPASLGGGATDFHVVYEGLSRVAADGVLLGARTLHGAQSVFSVWHPDLVAARQAAGRARHPVQIVATLTGVALAGGLLFNVPEIPVTLLTLAEAAAAMAAQLAERPWIRVIVMAHRHALADAFATLAQQGIRRVSCVGGRTLANELLDLHLVDDVYLTTARGPGGEPNTPLRTSAHEGLVVVSKRGTGDETGVAFEHIHLRRA
jgi:riboflavin biosynthesis pyrimidine reductase